MGQGWTASESTPPGEPAERETVWLPLIFGVLAGSPRSVGVCSPEAAPKALRRQVTLQRFENGFHKLDC